MHSHLIDYGEFTRQHTAIINVGRVGLNTLVVSQDLRRGRSWHGGDL